VNSTRTMWLVSCASLALPFVAHAQNISWTNTPGGKWEAAANWDQGSPTSNQSAILITNANSKTVTLDAATASGFPGTLAVSNLTLSSIAASTNTVSIGMGGPTVALHILNNFTLSGGGALFITNSALQVDTPGGNGTIVVDGLATVASGGTFLATNATVLLGSTNGADGEVSIAGAMVVSNLDAGLVSNSVGQITVLSGGSLTGTNSDSLVVGYALGSGGTITVSGGTLQFGVSHDFSQWVVGYNSGATGTLWLTGDVLTFTLDAQRHCILGTPESV